MKHVFTLIQLIIGTLLANASNISPIMSFNIQKEVKPPILSIVEGSVNFIEPSGNNSIDANEQCKLQFKVSNTGVGDAMNCIAKVNAQGNINGLQISPKNLPIIPVGETILVEIPLNTNMQTVDGKVDFEIFVEEPLGFGTDKFQMVVDTRAFVSPMLKVVDYTVTGDKGGKLMRNQIFDLQLLLQNTQYGLAEDVSITVDVPNGVFIMDNPSGRFERLKSGEQKSLVYRMAINNQYDGEVIPIKVKIREKFKKYSEDRTIDLYLNQKLSSTKIEVKGEHEIYDEIKIGTLRSDVDINIPQNNYKNDKTFAVIIANEDYQTISKVPYALNDGEVFSQYCQKTLGIPQSHIKLVKNATLNNIKHEINWLSNVIRAYDGDAKVIFYYAGHGIPDEGNRTSYLLPVDGNGNDVTTGYKLDDLYKKLGELSSESITVLLDACFSGAKRDGGMLASARGVAIKAKSGQPIGNMIVMSASQGDETAYPYKEKQHGMFTYFLLKKLQETKGEVNWSDLSSYITTNVSQKSIVINGKSQTPILTPSASVGVEWKTWTLR